MEVNDILSAILIGAVIGTLGRLALPGRQNIGVFVTLLVGIGAAVLGTFVSQRFDLPELPQQLWRLSWDWTVLGIQVGVAAVFTALATLIARSRLNTDVTPRRKASTRKARS
jgi:Predicted membrane protein